METTKVINEAPFDGSAAVLASNAEATVATEGGVPPRPDDAESLVTSEENASLSRLLLMLMRRRCDVGVRAGLSFIVSIL
jgi:hypothetical protein